MRTGIVALLLVLFFAIIGVGGLVAGLTTYKAPPKFRPATDAEINIFQLKYDELCHFDETGDWRSPEAKYMTPDYLATSATGHGPSWNINQERMEAQERTTWQKEVREKRQITSLAFQPDQAIVDYSGYMTCVTPYIGDDWSCPYIEKWKAEDTWMLVEGQWKLSKSVSLDSAAFSDGNRAEHSSLMPVWTDI